MSSKRVLVMTFMAIAAAAMAATTAIAQDGPPPKDRACVLDCREVYNRCTHAAHSTARLCIQGCEDLIAKARRVCTEDPESEECHAARREAVACVRECRETLAGDLRECRADAKQCVALCPDAEPMVPADPVCLRECRRQVRACLERANAAARECAEPCADLVAAALRLCTAAPRSDECAEARREASACLQPCRERLAAQTRECVANGQRCAVSCPPAVDSPSTGSSR
jgi:hypothetical protein